MFLVDLHLCFFKRVLKAEQEWSVTFITGSLAGAQEGTIFPCSLQRP